MRISRIDLAILAAFSIIGGPLEGGVIDFDSLSVGSVVDTLGEVTFSSNVPGLDLVVSRGFDTTSGDNYLGVGDGGFELFFPGDVVTLSFARPLESIRVAFISSPVTPSGVFELTTMFGSSASGVAPDRVLADGGEVFDVQFDTATPFTEVSLSSLPGFYSFNIDDISSTVALVPAPSSLLLVGLGLLVSGMRTRREKGDKKCSV